MQAALSRHRRAAIGLALLAWAVPARALDFGEVEVRSALGQRFDARIPLKAREGEWFHVTCLALAPLAAGAPLPGLGSATLSVERRRDSSNLRVRTRDEVNDPALAFGVTSSCGGAPQATARTFTVLLDPPGVARPAAEAAPPRAARPGSAPIARRSAPAASVAAPAPPERSPAPARESRAQPPAAPAPKVVRPGSGFVLRLDSTPMDLSRTRQFDDKSRALLRERLRLLDSDDQVAEMLSMRDNLRRLEARVSELQLKLAAVPPSFATAPAAPKTEPVTAKPAAQAAKAEAPPIPVEAPAPAPVPAAQTEAPAPKADTPAPKVEAPAPKVEIAPTKEAAAPARTAEPAPKAPAQAAPTPVESVTGALESFSGRVIAAGLALLALVVLLLGSLWVRWRRPAAVADEVADTEGEATVLMEPDSPLLPAAGALDTEQPIEIAPPARPEMATDAALATRLEEDTERLRRRYIEERFPEIRNGAILLDDPSSIVKGARLFYEDGAIPRAVELLSFAIEDRPAEIRPWLALFEIYRLERLGGEYAELAGRFLERHAASEQWPKVRGLGREIDPANPLYQEAPLQSLETIGPREARRNAAANVDPITENWLEAPMDFENEVLATELRRSLMARASIDERDLVPNPMPALRSVEMFSVG